MSAGVKIGSPIVYAPKAFTLAGDRIAGTSVDDRAGCAVVVGGRAASRAHSRSTHDPFRFLDSGRIQSARRDARRPSAEARHRHPARSHARDRHARHAGSRRCRARRRPGHEPLQLPWARHVERHNAASRACLALRTLRKRRWLAAAAQRASRRAHRFVVCAARPAWRRRDRPRFPLSLHAFRSRNVRSLRSCAPGGAAHRLGISSIEADFSLDRDGYPE